MLKLKHHISLPHISLPHQLQFAQVSSDDDELIQAIDDSAAARDDLWTLTPAPDTAELDTYWSHVQDDIHSDPSWQAFDEE